MYNNNSVLPSAFNMKYYKGSNKPVSKYEYFNYSSASSTSNISAAEEWFQERKKIKLVENISQPIVQKSLPPGLTSIPLSPIIPCDSCKKSVRVYNKINTCGHNLCSDCNTYTKDITNRCGSCNKIVCADKYSEYECTLPSIPSYDMFNMPDALTNIQQFVSQMWNECVDSCPYNLHGFSAYIPDLFEFSTPCIDRGYDNLMYYNILAACNNEIIQHIMMGT
jgi:hypothetical protein